MNYTPPPGNAVEVSWGADLDYVTPNGRSVEVSWGEARGDLRFKRPYDTSLPARLRFYPEEEVVVEDNEYTVNSSGRITGLKGAFLSRLGVVVGTSPTGRLAGIRGSAVATFDINVERPTVGQAKSQWQDGADTFQSVQSPYTEALTFHTPMAAPYQEGLFLDSVARFTWDEALSTLRPERVIPYQEGLDVRGGFADDFQPGIHVTSGFASEYAEAVGIRASWADDFQTAVRVAFTFLSAYQRAVGVEVGWRSSFQTAVWSPYGFGNRYQEAMKPPIGEYGGYVPPEPDPCYLPVLPAMLRFVDPYAGGVPRGDLRFWCERHPPVDPTDPGIVIPSLWTYIIVNTVSLKRVLDNIPVQFTAASVGIDNSSWCWSFTASISPHELEKVAPTDDGPVEVELEINGAKWRFIVESYTDSSTFAKTAYTIQGRSRSAYLDAPYAPTRSWVQDESLMSRQIAEMELARPGLVTGFTLDWDLAGTLGWEMPAGSYSFNEKTPIAVINEIVAGGGGYLNSHPYLPQLIARSHYPIPFWEWGAADLDFTIPRLFIKSQNLRWMEKPAYNGVRVSGQYTGVSGLYKRAGTDGAFTAPMITSPFITHADAARNVGRVALSGGGKQAQVSLAMPMRAADGLMTPGKLIEVVSGGIGSFPSWRGMVRSTEVAVTWSQGPEVAQTITLERHYGDIT